MGVASHKWYGWWNSIKNSYTNPNNNNYPCYGGRGLTMSREWFYNFEQFVQDVEALGPKPSTNTILERIDNNKGHSRNNCRWATKKENANNRRNNMLVKYQGRTQSLADWSRELGIKHKTLWCRLHDRGYTVKEAFSLPLNYGNQHH